MDTTLPRTLLRGYGLAAAAAAAAFVLGAGALACLLTLWLGGAAATFALAAFMPATDRPSRNRDAEELALAVALRRWEDDRIEDHPHDEAAPPAATVRRRVRHLA